MDEESMKPNFKTFYNTHVNGEDPSYSDSGLLYSEYVFKMFLERINPGSNLHKLSDGIYFMNGNKIIICRIAKGNLRISNIRTTGWDNLTPEQQAAATILKWDPLSWNRQRNEKSLFITNWSHFNPEQKEAATTLGWTLETWGKDVPYSKFYKTSASPFPLLHMDFQKNLIVGSYLIKWIFKELSSIFLTIISTTN